MILAMIDGSDGAICEMPEFPDTGQVNGIATGTMTESMERQVFAWIAPGATTMEKDRVDR